MAYKKKAKEYPNYYSKETRKARGEKIEATGNKCEKCHKTAKKGTLHFHHVDLTTNNNDYENLMLLCCSCHFLIHGKIVRQKNLDKRRFDNV